jgi:Phosphoglycerate dehydrogenase and related dehydrogenases
MTLLGSDPYVTAEQAALRGVELVDFGALIERSDAITVHVPLTRSTTGLIGEQAIARMKPGAFVLNVARGGIVDEAALASALREGRLGGAAIDVFEHEPPTGSPLLDAPNTVLTPHLGASTAEAQVAVAEEIAEQVLDVLDGRPARYAVNAPLLSPEAEQTIGPYLPLAELLGRFLAQFARAGVGTFTVELAGDLARSETAPLTAAALRGLIETGTTERVNLVNAAILARARGIAVVERKTTDAAGFPAAITVAGTVKGGHVTVGGTLAGGEMRLVRLNDYRLDMAIVELMLITRHRDRPGTIGRIGQLLGAADVNISAMHLARSAPRADALMILSVDDDVPPALEAAIRADEGVHDLWTIRLGPVR